MTPIELPDSSFTWPAKGIPPMTIYTCALGLPKGIGPKLQPRLSKLYAYLIVTAASKKAFCITGGNSIEGPAVQFNGNALCRLALALTNIYNLDITSPITKTIRLLASHNIKLLLAAPICKGRHCLTNCKKKPLIRPSLEDTSKPLSPL
ncbi:hypothetical protein BFJ63_vAg16302 [Fusarium oxysporum f. sp. narcissi]|uniref:Uncharacterized protein n=1 Tax=Fusarium oxysporum f. sp. narcissi TaxID=451672 RepID=A0A4Q2V712_FUSOX|nr:hypothetical protein BFJ63_vAg16302 [Fusarium oxysporum f. sp. narcissi]